MSSSAPAMDQQVGVRGRLRQQRFRPAAGAAAGGGRRRQALGVGEPVLGALAGRDEPHGSADALGERRGRRDRLVGGAGRPARDGDACRDEGPDEAVAIRRHDDRAGGVREQLANAALAGDQVLADNDRVGPLTASESDHRLGEGQTREREIAHARIGAERRVDLHARVAQARTAARGRVGAAGQRSRGRGQDVRDGHRRVDICQPRGEDERIATFGLTGESDENGSEHPFTVGPAVPTAIRDRMPMRLWQSRSHLALRHRWTPPPPGGRWNHGGHR